MSIPVVAIDGPSASGKGAVALRLSQELGYHCLDSGALYRLVALAGPETPESTAATMKVGFQGGRIFLSGQDVTDILRDEAVAARASDVAQRPGVRTALLQRQRAFRRPPGLVAEGRDMGSVVFPDAVLKIFLTASPERRAERRYKQLMDKGLSANMAALLQDIRERDQRDMRRPTAPLQRGADAVLIDTTSMSAADAVAQVLALYKQAPRAP